MSAEEALHGEQFNPHGPGWYQRPLPGMGHIGGTDELPVEHIFKHREIEPHPAEYFAVQNLSPQIRRVQTTALRPTQSIVDEPYLHGPSHPQNYAEPSAIQDSKGRYRMVDGHHRVARALLAGQKHIDVRVWRP